MIFKGRAWRAHDPRWSWQPTSGRGAAITGGRFNERGQEALYLALSPITALAECTQGFANRMLPLTLCEYDIDMADIIDLTDAATREAEGVKEADMACSWLRINREGKIAPSQKLARSLIKKGYNGAIVPSFVPDIETGSHNLVLWRWGDRPLNSVKVYDPEGRLEKG
ncbi:RES family NAD+ phosphorylase [Sphingorhabdus arenilitoris]|uniref:RES family NAD+ phosphorylase n=1 Tax=Sphingorhabdus arenilitoris TaxID=1490041 RepID=A0ABV8RE16_9SPHN